jgi:hypothetical protein
MHIADPYLWSTVKLIAKKDHGLNLLQCPEWWLAQYIPIIVKLSPPLPVHSCVMGSQNFAMVSHPTKCTVLDGPVSLTNCPGSKTE